MCGWHHNRVLTSVADRIWVSVVAGEHIPAASGGERPTASRRAPVRLPGRNRDAERRAVSLVGLDPDAAAVPLRDVPRDREPEPGAAHAADARLVHLVEAFEHA